MKRLSLSVVFGMILFSSVCNGQGWLDNLNADINRMTQNIQRNVNELTHNIQQTVQREVANANRLTKDLDKLNGTNGQVIINGQSTIINNSNGVSRITYGGVTSNGQRYVREVEEKTVGDILYHTERVSNPVTREGQTFQYTIDLSNPTLKPTVTIQ